ncbi:nucleoside triphosphate pyrophosphohydrolase [Beggiatoa leptomitoformis]|uniref:Nucleoside triphosphate pyrophosphohydrolase n=1 Tax=Beggiatoa leptomitoformis TaxID=288004 RepID=A0A2N9YF72_9GAMM|nr:nucleoside triphosphate pyrophosphohydrolase [Beggiatoa leptomitoformis]ALG68610.1 nucleoside triphosphate pyrophosphohydrolase [Beggiatoa leptomitoformis]AUI69045.1 nucleoside triphosphate pyrophosphohydrolase [Beggiatoa leptomitoformis]
MNVNPTDVRYTDALQRLLTIVNELRAQCPWDKEQTLDSLRYLTIEETYELSDAILENDLNAIKKELGDLMLHLVFYAKITAEQDVFDIADVMNGLCEKLIARHPHVYGTVNADDADTVKRHWEQLKLQEKGNYSALAGVPNMLPALVKAIRIQEKARGMGFDWRPDDLSSVWHKVKEEIQEFVEHIDPVSQKPHNFIEAENEFGDILFSLVNYARFVGINPENALEKTNKKFMRRFMWMETAIREANKQMHDLSLEELEFFWQQAKQQEKIK